MAEWWDSIRSLFTQAPEAHTVFDLLLQDRDRRANLRKGALIVLLFIVISMYAMAMYNQQDVIGIFEEPIDTNKKSIRQQATMLGALLSPQRIALICEYPMLYSFLGYTSPYTGPVVKALAALEPSIERVVIALTLLESGLVVDTTKTQPPTMFNEVVRQIYPADNFQPPQIIKAPTIPQQTTSMVQQILPYAINFLMMAPMLL